MLSNEWRYHRRQSKRRIPKLRPTRMRWTPTKPTGKTYSLDNATTMPEVCRPCIREDIDFSITGLSPIKIRCTFTYTRGKNYVNTTQTVVTALPPRKVQTLKTYDERIRIGIISLAIESLWMSKACCRGILGAPTTSPSIAATKSRRALKPTLLYDVPPGRARLLTWPALTGSVPWPIITMGIVLVAFLAARIHVP